MKKRMGASLIIAIMLFLYLSNSVKGEEKSDIYNDINQYLQSSVESLNIPSMSVIIVDKNNVLFSNTYGNDHSIDTPFIIGSMSKSFTAVSVMQLVEKGKINLDENISVYLPDFSEGDKITVRQLLNQISGLGEYQNLSNAKITNSYGTHQYANVNYSILGKIIESVSGISYDEYVSENIFKPLGMNHSAATLEGSKANGLIDGYRNFFGKSVAGEADYPDKNSWSQVPSGYISSSSSDMGKYLQMYLNNGQGVLTEQSVNTIFHDNVYVKSDPPYYYGMGWTLSEGYDEPILGHTGLVENYMSNMFILPERKIGIVLLSNTNDYLVTNSMMETVSGSIVLMLLGKEPIAISKNQYFTSHLLLDVMYIVVFFIALLPFLLLGKYKKKLKAASGKSIILLCVVHLILPTLILLIPRFLNAPLWVARYYVPDLFIVLITSAILLYAGGIIKLIIYCKVRVKEEDKHLMI